MRPDSIMNQPATDTNKPIRYPSLTFIGYQLLADTMPSVNMVQNNFSTCQKYVI